MTAAHLCESLGDPFWLRPALVAAAAAGPAFLGTGDGRAAGLAHAAGLDAAAKRHRNFAERLVGS